MNNHLLVALTAMTLVACSDDAETASTTTGSGGSTTTTSSSGGSGGTGGVGGQGGTGGTVDCIEDPMVAPGSGTTFDSLTFDQVAPFVQMSDVWGDRATGPHGTVAIFNANADSGPHTHSEGYWGVVISGMMQNPFGTEVGAPDLGPGAFWYVPAGEQHSTLCISAEPCTFYFHAEGAFDFTPIMAVTDPPSGDAVALTAAEIAFMEATPFVSFGPAWGNMQRGAHGTFGLFPGMASSPAHVHSDEYYGVVISGIVENPFDGEANPPMLPAGSAWHVPADSNHITACVSSEDCLFYFHARSAFDFAPICE
jgi:quercetin dioxygenase-like cupin family protein